METREINLTPRRIVRFPREGRTVYENITPRRFTKERAEEIWATRGIEHALTMELEEEAYVHAVWDTMGGNTCFMDAFHLIRGGVYLVNKGEIKSITTEAPPHP